MVRRNELACRDEWSRSLWQPRDSQHSNGDMPFQRPTPGPLPPTLPENLRSVLDHDIAVTASSQGEDVLLSEARIVSEARESWESQPRPFPAGNFDPRTAIFRAREAYRERVRAKSAAERQSAGLEAMVASPPAEDFDSATAEESALGSLGPAPHEHGAAANGGLLVRSADEHPWLDEPDDENSRVTGPTLSAAETPSEEVILGGPSATAGATQPGETEAEWRPTAVRGEQPGMQAPRIPAFEEADSDKARVEPDETGALPDWYRADLPRICRTCRDFRPSTDGQRGWCANSWAFTHRRLVLEEDPAPCQSAIGDWWLPVDDVWLVAADVSSHGRATPLLDRLTGKTEHQRRRS
jgi:hypothetical protein